MQKPENRNAETAAIQSAFEAWRRDSRHGDLIAGLDEGEFDAEDLQWAVIRRAFEAGAASRQAEVDRLNKIVTLAYRGAECARPISSSVGFTTERGDGLSSSTRRSCGECWGCRLAKAAADYRGLK